MRQLLKLWCWRSWEPTFGFGYLHRRHRREWARNTYRLVSWCLCIALNYFTPDHFLTIAIKKTHKKLRIGVTALNQKNSYSEEAHKQHHGSPVSGIAGIKKFCVVPPIKQKDKQSERSDFIARNWPAFIRSIQSNTLLKFFPFQKYQRCIWVTIPVIFGENFASFVFATDSDQPSWRLKINVSTSNTFI